MSETVDVTVKLPRPPAGKEWHHAPLRWPNDPDWMQYDEASTTIVWKLRPIVSATVMVEMSRDDARRSAERCSIHDFNLEECDTNNLRCRLATAARAALARRPCPVMVCALYGGKSKDCWRKDTHEQRPCKLSEGHGGGHE